MPLTVCLLNWRRPRNLRRLVDCLAAQTIRPRLFLWNNAPGPFRHPAVEWLVESGRNAGCAPRWWMAAQAATEFVASMDDDLMPADDRVLEDLLRVAAARPRDCAVGPYGAVFRRGRPYAAHEHVACPTCDRAVDLVKGRCLIVRVEAIRHALRLGDLGDPLARDNDDVALCGALSAGRRLRHVVPGKLDGRFVDLPEGDAALWRRPDHFARRESARRRWFGASGKPPGMGVP